MSQAPLVIPEHELKRARELQLLHSALAARRVRYPAEFLEISRPTPANPWANQIGYLTARQRIRVLTPGNRWGKTTAMGLDAHETAMLSGRFQPALPRPARMIWFSKRMEQFDLVLEQLSREVFGSCAKWKGDKFTWDNGSYMIVAVADSGNQWQSYMGIEVDAVYFDELPKSVSLYREMRMRETTTAQARITISGTAVDGESWVQEELYDPWLKWHGWREGDLSPDLCGKQHHPGIWFWPRGGIRDNPGISERIKTSRLSETWSSDEEKQVRDTGGFARFGGMMVFDRQGLMWLEERTEQLETLHPTRTGILRVKPGPTPANTLPTPDGLAIWQCQPIQIKDREFEFLHDPTLMAEGYAESPFRGRVTIFEDPKPGRTYVMGADFAFGIGRDWDTVAIYDKTATMENDGLPRQVAEAEGQWGESFHAILYALHRMYNGAFLLGERQAGIGNLRTLRDQYGVPYGSIYHQQDHTRDKPMADLNPKLGWPKTADDQMVWNLRAAVRTRKLIIRSRPTLAQMADLRYVPRTSTSDQNGDPDHRLTMKLRKGSPDLAWAQGYANMALGMVYEFRPKEPLYAPGTYGHLFNLEQKMYGPGGAPDPRPGVPGLQTGVKVYTP